VNVHGTENILELARRMKKLELLLHISTVYVAGRLSGPLHEAQLLHPNGWFSPYEQSKFEAEKLVIEKGSGLPWVIARLSTVIGNSVTGAISQFNYFHQLLRLVPNNRFPFIPGEPQTPVDVIADDWVLGALEVLLRANLSPGTIVHLCAGPSQALPAQQIVELAFRHHRLQQPNSASGMPRFVSLEEFQAFAKGLKRKGETALSRMAELLLLYLPHLHVQQSFLNEQTNSLLRNEGMVPPRTAEYLPRIIQSCF
jgi:nucleoside-diphosphate-sugar epimerase